MKKIALCLLLSLNLLGHSSLALASDASKPTIKFATEATYPPIVTMSNTGTLGGFETELVKSICQEANLNCEFVHRPFDSLFPSLAFKKIDAVYGGIGITDARKDQVLFSKVLYTMPVGFIFTDPFEGQTIGIQQGTTVFEQYLKKHYPNAKFKTYASIQDALLDLKNKRIQAVFGDIPVFKYWLKNTHNHDILTFNFLELNPEQMSEFSHGNGIAVAKDKQVLIDQINAAFDKVVANGTYQKLKEFYYN